MSNHKRLCPICRRPVQPTKLGNVGGHLDKAGHPCPASYNLNYQHTLTPPPKGHP
jgi:hypothetical protein